MTPEEKNFDFLYLLNIYRNGKYWFPACNQYIKKLGDNQTIVVSCDLCKNQNIKSCYGYKDNDLCIPCVIFLLDKENTLKDSTKKKPFNKNLDNELDKIISNSDNKELTPLIHKNNEDSDVSSDSSDSDNEIYEY